MLIHYFSFIFIATRIINIFSKEIFLDSSSNKVGKGTLDDPCGDLEYAFQSNTGADSLILKFLDSKPTNAYSINGEIKINSATFAMIASSTTINLYFGSTGTLLLDKSSDINISNISIRSTIFRTESILSFAGAVNIFINNLFLLVTQAQKKDLLVFEGCLSVNVNSLILQAGNKFTSTALNIRNSRIVKINNTILNAFESIQENIIIISLLKTEIIEIQNLICNSSILNKNNKLLLIQDSQAVSVNNNCFQGNKLIGIAYFLEISGPKDILTTKVVLNSNIFKDNTYISGANIEQSALIFISFVDTIAVYQNLFTTNHNFYSFLDILNGNKVQFDLNIITSSNAQVGLRLSSVESMNFYNSHFESNNIFCESSVCKPEDFSGPSIIIEEFLNLNVIGLSVINSRGTSSPPGIMVKSTNEKANLNIENYLCFNNLVNQFSPDYYISSNCLFLSIGGEITIKLLFVINNHISSGGGNNCFNSDSTVGTLKVESSYFLSNRAVLESICFKYYGTNVELTGLVFDDNKNPSDLLVSTNEAGALHLGCETITIKNSTFSNGTAYSAAGIFFHNLMGKGSQLIRAQQLIIKNNNGESTAAMSFHSSIGIVDLEMVDSIITNNSVKFHAIVSFFFSGVIGNSLRFYGLEMSMNVARSIGGCFFLASIFCRVYYENSSFIENSLIGKPFLGGTIFLIYGGDREFIIYSKNCKFLRNYCESRGGTVLVQYGQYHDQGSQFEENYSPFAGALSFEVTAITSLTNTLIKGKRNSHTGAVYLSGSANLLITNSTFHSCGAKNGGGVITAFGALVILNVYESVFYNNEGEEDASVLQGLISKVSQVMFVSCRFLNNSRGRGIFLTLDVDMVIDSCIFDNNPTGAFEIRETLILIKNSTFSRFSLATESLSNSIIKLTSLSLVIIINSVFDNLDFKASPPLCMADKSTVKLISSIITNLHFGNVFTGISSDYLADEISITHINAVLFTLHTAGSLVIRSSNLSSISNQESIFSLLNLNLIEINSCAINNLSASKALGAISISITQAALNTKKVTAIYILNSTFVNCSSNEGGVLRISNANLQMVSSSFIKNRAQNLGGAIHLLITSNEVKPDWNISKCVFTENSAGFGGGAIKYSGYLAVTNENVFKENLAVFGANELSYPTDIAFSSWTEKTDQLNYFDCKNNIDICKLSNLVSGKDITDFALEIRDTFGQPYHEDGVSGKIDIEIGNTTGVPNYLEGSTLILAEMGRIIYDSVRAIAKPGSTANITANVFIPTLFSLEANDPTILSKDKGYLRLVIPSTFRKCILGEIEISTTNICYECPEGSYSLNLKDKSCSKCIANSKCRGGARIELNPGFWRKDHYSIKIYSCNDYVKSCVGGYENVCAQGYTGILCSECEGGSNKKEIFFKKNLFLCESCDLWKIYISILIILVMVFICAIIIMIHRQSQQANAPPSIGKILSTHLQYVYQTTSQGTSLPSPVKSITNSLSVAISSEGLFNILSCMQVYIPVSLYLLRLIITLFSMVTFVLGLLILWSLVGWAKKIPRKVLKTKIVSSIVVITYFLHANYVNFFVTNLSCKQYDDTEYLANNLDQECWDTEHTLYSASITIPMVIIWMLVLPLIVYKLVRLYHDRKLVNFKNVVFYFVNGFKERYYYWEFVLLIEKYIFILLPIIIKSSNTLPALFLYAFFLLVFLIIHVEIKPYSSSLINRLQLMSFYACFISYFVSITSQLTDNEAVKITISVVYFISNGGFYLYWFLSYYNLVIKAKLDKIKSTMKTMKSKSKMNNYMGSFESDSGSPVQVQAPKTKETTGKPSKFSGK